MKVQTCLAFVLAIPAAASAQTYDASPDGLLNREGGARAFYLGAYSSSRSMLLDDELRGKAGSIKQVAFRVDYWPHGYIPEVGRSWNKVTLKISDCDLSRSSATFSNNPTSTPSLVFSGRTAWPALKGYPSTQPAKFGHTNGSLLFPFRTVWAYRGSTDICLDFDFDGGALANNSPWPASAERPYFLDGYFIRPTSYSGWPRMLGQSVNSGCVDTGAYNGLAGFANLLATTYSLSSPINAGKSVLHVSTIFTAANRPVTIALSSGGFPAGVTFPGVTCNKLYVDMSKPSFVTVKQPRGPYALTRFDLASFDYLPGLVGVPMYLQAAWNDSTTGAVLLTNGVHNAIPRIPRAHLRRCVFTHVVANKNTTGTLFARAEYNPVLRYTR